DSDGLCISFFFMQAEDGIRDFHVTGVQTCALPIYPVITGRVYNAANMPPWKLPENATQMGIYSRSTPDGDYHTANAIRFEDRKGQEQLWIHAERNQDTEVENDETHSVGRDRKKDIGNDQTENIGNNNTISVGVTNSRSVGVASTEQVGVFKSTFVGVDQLVVVGGAKQEMIGKSLNYLAGENIAIEAGKIFEIKAGDKFRVEVGETRLEMDKSGVVVIKSPQTTIVKGGEAQFTIGPGTILHSPDLVIGKAPVPPSQCLRAMAAQRPAFV